MKPDRRPTRSEVNVRKDKFDTQYFHAAFSLSAIESKMFLGRKKLSKISCFITLVSVQLIFFCKDNFNYINIYLGPTYKSKAWIFRSGH